MTDTPRVQVIIEWDSAGCREQDDALCDEIAEFVMPPLDGYDPVVYYGHHAERLTRALDRLRREAEGRKEHGRVLARLVAEATSERDRARNLAAEMKRQAADEHMRRLAAEQQLAALRAPVQIGMVPPSAPRSTCPHGNPVGWCPNCTWAPGPNDS